MSLLLEEFELAQKRHDDRLRAEGSAEAFRMMAAMLDAVGGELAIPRDSLAAIDAGYPLIQREDSADAITYRLRLRGKE